MATDVKEADAAVTNKETEGRSDEWQAAVGGRPATPSNGQLTHFSIVLSPTRRKWSTVGGFSDCAVVNSPRR